MAKANTWKLNNGLEIPTVGLGTYALELDLVGNIEALKITNPPRLKPSSREGSVNKSCKKAVIAAVEYGYRHIDTAAFYQNEEEIGEAINELMAHRVIKREEVFITTKLWNDRHAFEQVEPSLRESLSKLNLPFVDLFLVHWPLGLDDDGSYNDVDYLDTWRGMEKCYELGLAKSIGISNFNTEQMDRLLKNCKIQPVVNQVEVNLHNSQKPMIEYCKERNIVVTAYSPLGCMTASRATDTSPPPKMDDPLLNEIGKKYNKNPSQIALRYLHQIGCVVIPKSVTPARIAQNINIFDFSLTPDEMQQLDSFNKDQRIVLVKFWKTHKHYPFKQE